MRKDMSYVRHMYVCESLGSLTCTMSCFATKNVCLRNSNVLLTKSICLRNIMIFDLRQVMSYIRSIYFFETLGALTCTKSCLTNEKCMFANH